MSGNAGLGQPVMLRTVPQEPRVEDRAAPSLLAAARDDPRAFGDFYRAYASRLLLYFSRRVFDPEVAADLTGETFAVAYERRKQFRGTSDQQEQGWLFAIARRLLSSYWRQGEVERRALERLGLEPPVVTHTDLELLEGVAAIEMQRQKVVTALRRLPTDQQQAVEARIVKGRAYAEIAAGVGASEQVIRARVSRGLKTLHRHLGHLIPEEAL